MYSEEKKRRYGAALYMKTKAAVKPHSKLHGLQPALQGQVRRRRVVQGHVAHHHDLLRRQLDALREIDADRFVQAHQQRLRVLVGVDLRDGVEVVPRAGRRR